MSENPKQVYGPLTLECSQFGWFTKFFLWFLPTYIYENKCTVMIYKRWRGTMYVTKVSHKPHQIPPQFEQPWRS